MGLQLEPSTPAVTRRSFVGAAASGVTGLLATGGIGMATAGAGVAAAEPGYGPLLPPDNNGVSLPQGFTSRIVARSGDVVAGTDHRWHDAPDGGACFPAPAGGWIYVSNSEVILGGVGAIRFDAAGQVTSASAILTGTTANCAGGPTPWGTWLSCEEHPFGQVWECDPSGAERAVVRPAMGRFTHEAAAVHEAGRRVYLTEDTRRGRFRRFTPTAWPDLAEGVLEAAAVGPDGKVVWVPDGDPTASPFDGGEGAWALGDAVVFATKGDSRVWRLDTATSTLTVLYDGKGAQRRGALQGMDNITGTPTGELVVAEDGGNLELVALDPITAAAEPLLRLTGHDRSELAGPAFSPDGSRLYLSSQRGTDGRGVTFEISGPFRRPPPTTTTTTTSSTASTTLAKALGRDVDSTSPEEGDNLPWLLGGAGTLGLAGAAAILRLRTRRTPAEQPDDD